MSQDMNYLPEILDEFEEESLLEQPNLKCFTGMRNYAIIYLILNSGLTPSEVVEMKWDSIDLIEGVFDIRKEDPRKNRRVHINFEVTEALNSWYYRQRNELGNCQYLFTTMNADPISKRYLRSMISRYSDKAFICKDVSPYTLRHTFGAKLYRCFEDIKEVQRSLGLSSSNYAKMYSLLADEDINILLY